MKNQLVLLQNDLSSKKVKNIFKAYTFSLNILRLNSGIYVDQPKQIGDIFMKDLLGINEEDTLELLKVRHRDDKEFNESINEIFYPDGKKNDYNENRLNYNDFLENMTNLVLKKRDMIKDKRDNYCNYIKDKI